MILDIEKHDRAPKKKRETPNRYSHSYISMNSRVQMTTNLLSCSPSKEEDLAISLPGSTFPNIPKGNSMYINEDLGLGTLISPQ